MRIREFMQGPTGYAAAATIILFYIFFSLTPFRWAPPQKVINGAVQTDGAVRFATPGIVRSINPPDWLRDIIQSNSFTLRLRATPASEDQVGPSRIFTISLDTYHRNLTVGQEGTALVLRLRTTETDLDGQPEYVIRQVFEESQLCEIELNVGDEMASLYINGKLALEQVLPLSPLENWDANYRMALGNELTGDRPWLGEIEQADVEVKGQLFDCLTDAAFERPESYWPMPNWERIVSVTDARQWHTWDVFLNLVCFIPLGFCLAFTEPTRRSFWLAICFVAVLSLSIEMVQVAFERHPSAIDWIMNVLGAVIGRAGTQFVLGNRK
jgi:VanZ family protein